MSSGPCTVVSELIPSNRLTQGRRWAFNFGTKFYIPIEPSNQHVDKVKITFLTLMAGSPAFLCRKSGMLSCSFCDFPMWYLTSGDGPNSGLVCAGWLVALKRARIRRIRACRRSI
jgi:hypothetical protein